MAVRHKLTAKDWADVKPTFLRLYHDEDKSLHEVRRELAANHNFNASKSAFTRQIERWNAFKNYKSSDKQRWASQRISGHRPSVDFQGRSIKWDRVYRATRAQKIRERRQTSRMDSSHPAEHREGMALAETAQAPLLQPLDNDSCALSCVVEIWRQSTAQYALKDPSAPSYYVEHAMYTRLMRSMTVITLSSNLHWPKLEIHSVCEAVPELIRTQPAIACDMLTFLTAGEALAEQHLEGYTPLRDQLFDYIRDMSRYKLPETSPFRRFTSYIDGRHAFTRLGAAIAKAKLETMWNTRIVRAAGGRSQHHRPFFRQVLVRAILVAVDYGEFEFVTKFLKKLSDCSDTGEPFYLSAYARLLERQGALHGGEGVVIGPKRALTPLEASLHGLPEV